MSACAVYIVSYNTCELLRACLDGVLANSPAPVAVAVVDNGSSDGTIDMLTHDYPSVRLVKNAHNTGYGPAANQAFAACVAENPAETVLVLNSDTRLAPDALQQLTVFLDAQPEVGLAGPRLINTDGSLQPSCFHFPTLIEVLLDLANAHKVIRHLPKLRAAYLRTWDHTYSRAVPWVSGAALAVRRRAFEAVNGFDPSFWFYYEETDLCFRLWRAGWKVCFAPVTDVVHVGGGSSASAGGRARQAHLTVQLYASLAHFYRRHYPKAAWGALGLLLKTTALLRYMRDGRRLRQLERTGGLASSQRESLILNRSAWHTMLRGQWASTPPQP